MNHICPNTNHTISPSICLANLANECATKLAPLLTHKIEKALSSLPIHL